MTIRDNKFREAEKFKNNILFTRSLYAFDRIYANSARFLPSRLINFFIIFQPPLLSLSFLNHLFSPAVGMSRGAETAREEREREKKSFFEQRGLRRIGRRNFI